MRIRRISNRVLRMLLAATLCCAVSPVLADQFEYLSLQQATEALAMLDRNQAIVYGYCAPCGDRAPTPIRPTLLELGRVWDRPDSARPYESNGQTFWEVLINGKAVDLAYLYVERDGQWVNLALSMGLKAIDVPASLPKPD